MKTGSLQGIALLYKVAVPFALMEAVRVRSVMHTAPDDQKAPNFPAIICHTPLCRYMSYCLVLCHKEPRPGPGVPNIGALFAWVPNIGALFAWHLLLL